MLERLEEPASPGIVKELRQALLEAEIGELKGPRNGAPKPQMCEGRPLRRAPVPGSVLSKLDLSASVP